jgi:DNA helicase-2/ATP-dependent DNA helicase PcrA
MKGFRQYLNPIYRRLDEVIDFSDIQTSDELINYEYPYLEDLAKLVFEDINVALKRMDSLGVEIEHSIWLIDTETGDDKTDAVKEYNRLMKEMETLIERINRQLTILDTPYFGKIIFDRKGNKEVADGEIKTYIGKFAFFDKNTNKPLISDWRAPIANLYYQNSGPSKAVHFSSPIGDQNGDLTQKRQFELSETRIQSIYDAKSGNAAADEFLLSQLNQKIGKKLSDIVSTIQSQQNEIIRDSINKPVIIQGVAGSGKTTIILHRLAYLFYTFNEEIMPELSLIIAPNKMFLDYISDVLPSLGVKGLEQNTYLFWARDVLGFDKKYAISPEKENDEVMRIKGSMRFKRLMDQYFHKIERETFENMPGSIAFDVEIRYYELKETHPEMTMTEMIDLSIDYAFAQLQFKKQKSNNLVGNLMESQERRKKVKDYVKKQTNVYKIYKDLFKRDDIAAESELTEEEWKLIKKQTRNSFKGATSKVFGYKQEDLAPLVWLHFQIHGAKDSMRDHIVVDEAQDLSVFQLMTLSSIAKKGNITIAGDVAQSIVPPFHISDWQQVIDGFEETFPDMGSKISYHQLHRSYRTTIEIIDYANKIFEKFFPKTYRLPEAVLRHGEKVQNISTKKQLSEGDGSDLEMLVALLNIEHEKGAVSSAVICRDESHATKILEALQPYKDRIHMNLVDYKEDDYQTGVLVLPISRAKGLEFDSVLIMDADDNNYSDNELDVRLFYVAVTRALHRLYIFSSQSEPDSKLLNS